MTPSDSLRPVKRSSKKQKVMNCLMKIFLLINLLMRRKQTLQYYMEIMEANLLNRCHKCGNAYTSASARSDHKRRKHPEFRCNMCPFTCIRCTLYDGHLRTNEICRLFTDLLTTDLTAPTNNPAALPMMSQTEDMSINDEIMMLALNQGRHLPREGKI